MEIKSDSSGRIERKRSRFDEVGELGRERDVREERDGRSGDRSRGDYRSTRDDRNEDRDKRDDKSGRDHREGRDDRGSMEGRDDRGSREGSSYSYDYRHRDDRSDDRGKRQRDDRDTERDREYDRYRRERGERYRNDRNIRDGHSDRNSRYGRDDGRRLASSVEIPFDRFLRLSPWRGPVTPLEERPRHLKNWDIPPAGFERISADKAKQTGLFPPPGNMAKTSNYVPPTLDPARAAMFQLLNRDLNVPLSSSTNVELSGNLAKQAKRFYVGNLPHNFNEAILVSFLESNLQGLSSKDGESKVHNLNVSSDRSYAFVECRTAEDASLAMNLDGVCFEGIQLKVRRPKEYHIALTTGQLASSTKSEEEATISVSQIDNSVVNKRQLIISGIPDILSSEHVTSLLLLIADLRTFLLLKDRQNDKSLGLAVFEFVEDVEGDEWSGPFLKHSNGSLFMGPFEMKIRRVCELMEDVNSEGDVRDNFKDIRDIRDILSIYNLKPGYATAPTSTPILQLLNIVTRETLLLDYDSILTDLITELQKYGTVLDLVVPKPSGDSDNLLVPGVGKVFVKYEKVEMAARAASELAGRIFDGHGCIVSFYPPEMFEKKLF